MATSPPNPIGIRHRSRQQRAQTAADAPPIDHIDEEVNAAAREGRQIDLDTAFPEPPPAPPPPRRRGRATSARPQPRPSPRELQLEPVNPEDMPPPPPTGRETPAERWRAVARFSPAYKTEYQLRIVHRLLMRGTPNDVMAAQLGVSVATINRLRVKLNERLAYEAQTTDGYNVAGKTLMFYDEVRAAAMRLADDGSNRVSQRILALQTALNAEADKQRFLHASGFWQAAPFRPREAADDAQAREAKRLHDMVEMVLDPATGEVDFSNLPDEASDDGDLRLL